MKPQVHTIRWFKNRIGKRVYRVEDTKCCKHCDDVFKNGLIISDEQHAQYLLDCQNELKVHYYEK